MLFVIFRNIQTCYSPIIGHHILEMDIPIHDTAISTVLFTRGCKYRLCSLTHQYSFGIVISHYLLYFCSILSYSCGSETNTTHIGKHVFLCTTYHCNSHQYSCRYGYPGLAKDCCCHNGLCRSDNCNQKQSQDIKKNSIVVIDL